MKLKKKNKIIFSIILLFAIIMGINYSNAEDNTIDSFYMKESYKTRKFTSSKCLYEN